MSLHRSIVSFVFLTLTLSFPSIAQGFQTDAKQAYIIDFDSGLTLFSKAGNAAMIPASMTKMMTAYVVFERLADGSLSLDDEFTVSENAWRKGGAASGGSTMFLPIGDQVRVEDLLRGVIIQSGNDACIVLAEGISGSEEAFALEMTSQAKSLGLSSANFKNATGLNEDGHEISPEDLARLARAIIQDHPEMYALYSETEFTWNGIRQSNRNPLLYRFEGADGLKTGHLDVSGYGLVASAERDGHRRIVVMNGLESEQARAAEAERLMRASFREFEILEVFDAGEQIGSVDVYLGMTPTVPVQVEEAVNLGLHRSDADNVSLEIVYNGPVRAPVSEGEQLGELLVSAHGETLLAVPLLASVSVEKQSFTQQVLTGASMRLTGGH